jgi:ubiquitin carboxyl-terminal hydrolase 36/42
MSVVAPNQTQIQRQQPQSPPAQSKTNAHFYDLLHGKNASKNSTSSSILNDMLASAQQMTFSDPVGKNAIALGAGVREIAPGPRSPKANGNSHATLPKVNGHGANGNGNGNGHAQEDDEDDDPDSPPLSKAGPSKLIGPVQPSPSSRKGKEPASAPIPRKERVLYEDPINLNWPDNFKTRKSAAAGLYNPSMACYANATLQVLLHTPPVLRIAQSHDSKNCK